MTISTIDSYSEEFVSGGINMYVGAYILVGQCFTCDNDFIFSSCKFYLKKVGSPTGSAYAKLFALSGTYGVDAKPTGSALATSDAYNISRLTTDFELITFNFTGINKITLTAGNYFIVFQSNNGNSSNSVNIGYDAAGATHDGNRVMSTNILATTWLANVNDVAFYVYGTYTSELGYRANPGKVARIKYVRGFPHR